MGWLYWKIVLHDAWRQTWRLMSWSGQKVATAAVVLISTTLTGGLLSAFHLLSASLGLVLGVPIVATTIFVWSVVQCQAGMYSDLLTTSKSRAATLDNRIHALESEVERLKAAPPDLAKWRHVERLPLRTAAQLWSDQRPQAGLFGSAKEAYEMLRGAIQGGTLEFEHGITDPYMRQTRGKLAQENPNADTVVTRSQLLAFAKKYGYDPAFLRDG